LALHGAHEIHLLDVNDVKRSLSVVCFYNIYCMYKINYMKISVIRLAHGY